MTEEERNNVEYFLVWVYVYEVIPEDELTERGYTQGDIVNE